MHTPDQQIKKEKKHEMQAFLMDSESIVKVFFKIHTYFRFFLALLFSTFDCFSRDSVSKWMKKRK